VSMGILLCSTSVGDSYRSASSKRENPHKLVLTCNGKKVLTLNATEDLVIVRKDV